jgi:hypothetical protein
MSYEGEILNQCPADIDFSHTWAVVVSGASWNKCGHMLFCCGNDSDTCWYFHVAGQGLKELGGIRAYPKFMRGDSNFARYLLDNGKKEIRRLDVRITNPQGAYSKLMDAMDNEWYWGVLLHNCATFTRDIVTAGGGQVEVLLNCPDREFANKVEKGIDAALEGIAKSIPYGIGM